MSIHDPQVAVHINLPVMARVGDEPSPPAADLEPAGVQDQPEPQPEPDPQPSVAAYRQACARYTLAVRAAQHTRESAETRYRSEVSAVRKGAQRAVAEREASARDAAQANQLVVEADDTSADLWRRLGSYVGDRRMGPTPAPDLDADPAAAADVTKLLARTRITLSAVQRGERPFPPPKNAVAVAGAIGAVCGLIAAIVAGLLLGNVAGDGHAQAMSQAEALVVLFVGAFAGIPIVTGWLSTRHRLGAKPPHIGACVAGAVLVICALAPWLLVG